MQLNPRTPPGRSNRKARAYATEIARLRSAGYGCLAIREALADAGVNVSKSTVQREIARLSRPASLAPRLPQVTYLPKPSPMEMVRAPEADSHLFIDERRSGKDIAEAFMKGRITNPLIRNRS